MRSCGGGFAFITAAALIVTLGLGGTEAKDGLYVSNGTAILFISRPDESPLPVYVQEYSRIVGLTYDLDSSMLFWSDIDHFSKGIFQASIETDGTLSSVTHIVNTDIMEVNGLTIDWVSNNLYWTDARKKTIEVMNYVTKHRRVLIYNQLNAPRGIYADPINGYLFWNDQGYERIERSRLDGSERKEIVSERKYPNQMVMYNSQLYWVNSVARTLETSNLDGGRFRILSDIDEIANKNNIYGLAIFQDVAYITNWADNLVITVQISTGSNQKIAFRGLGSDALFSAAYYSQQLQPSGVADKCSSSGCSHLCLPTGVNTARCSCPSLGGLMLRGSTCEAVSGDILLYVLADSGYVGYQSKLSGVQEQYLIGRSLRPVGVAYDPVQKVVYWSDVTERTIRKSKLDGTGQSIFLNSNQGLGVVDGMVLDHQHRQLYYTNTGSVSIDGFAYTWHKIETVQLDAPHAVRTVVDVDEKPRALALDLDQGYLYYTDWSSRARIVRTNLDGSHPKELRAGLDNPNGLALVGSGTNKRLYVTDSHYKTRNSENYPGDKRNGSVYSMKLNGSDWKNEFSSDQRSKILTPFGLSSDGATILYISDWDRQVLTSFDLSASLKEGIILDMVESPMMLLHTPVSATASGTNPCRGSDCGDVCLSSPADLGPIAICSCNSYSAHVLASDLKQCQASEAFIAVGDMSSLKLYSLDGSDMSAYAAAQGLPYYTNIVGVAYDEEADTLYYSDINSNWIMAMSPARKNSTHYFQINDTEKPAVIDGMTIHGSGDGRRLYWTDSANGHIAYLKLHGRAPSNYTVVIEGLRRPRAIRISEGFIYWTEWGEEAARVAKLALSSFDGKAQPTKLSIPDVKWPNGLFIDQTNNRLYVADGHPSSPKILKCILDQLNCSEIEGLQKTLKHVYDIFVHNDIIYYSDWKSSAVLAYSERHQTTWSLLKGIMRPSQMFVKLPQPTNIIDYCGTNKGGCSDICVSLIGKRRCACSAGKLLSVDDHATCIDPTTAPVCNVTSQSLVYGVTSQSLQYGAIFKPPNDSCISCQCRAGSRTYSDAKYGPFQCDRTSIEFCPAQTCAGDGKTVILPNSCCPVCTKQCSIKITDCPLNTITLTLPDDRNYAVYEYLPSVRDCLGLSREIKLTKTPASTLYSFTTPGDSQLVMMNAAAVSGGDKDADKCEFRVVVTDDTRPTITCPQDSQLYTAADQVQGVWSAPTIFDNVGFKQPQSNPAWGSNLQLGPNVITYTVKDNSNLEATCSFVVTVAKLEQTQCAVPHLINGKLQCKPSGNNFVCDIECDRGYINAQTFTRLTCANSQWKQDVEFFSIKTCIKYQKFVRGSILAIGKKACARGANIKLKYTEDFIQDKVTKLLHQHASESPYSLKSTLTATGCRDSQNDDVNVKINLLATYSNESHENDAKKEVDRLLQQISDALSQGTLVLTYSFDEGIHTTRRSDITVTVSNAIDVCPEGSVKTSTGSCAVCSAGMHADDDECQPCPVNKYNELEGQTQCERCPGGTTSPEGSYNRFFCAQVPLCSFVCIIAIVATAGAIILIVLVTILACFIVKKKKENTRDQQYETIDLNKNACKDDVYECLDDVCDGKAESAADDDKENTEEKIAYKPKSPRLENDYYSEPNF